MHVTERGSYLRNADQDGLNPILIRAKVAKGSNTK